MRGAEVFVLDARSDDSMRVLRLHLLLLVAVLLAACSSGASLADYAEDVETLIVTMNARLDALDAEFDATQDLEEMKEHASQRILARSRFLTGLRELEPPDEVVELHETALGIMERLTDAETAMADRVMSWESASDIEAIWETPEGIAARTADAQAVALCLAAQADFDQTSDRAEFEAVPWIPPEMKEVVLVAFGCEADGR
jgi:hypothetical protein